jgi:methionyl-tRNA formyltransferase
MTQPCRIVFMGTPAFAVPALQHLANAGHTILQVVTQPDRPKGRGKAVEFSPVKQTALDLGCPVMQPLSVRDSELSETLFRLNPDFLVVVAYGQVLPRRILSIPRIAAINIHASLLPRYRGPAPIQWAIINREKETGITLMLMDEGLDTGDILASASVPIRPDDTSGALHDRLAVLGADMLVQTLAHFEIHQKNAMPQAHDKATYAPMLKKEDGHLDWKKSAEDIEALIRGLTPWPGAFCFLNGKRIKIFRVTPKIISANELPGTVIKGFPDELTIATGCHALIIQELQGDSGKRLPVRDFLRGHSVVPGTILD